MKCIHDFAVECSFLKKMNIVLSVAKANKDRDFAYQAIFMVFDK